MGARRLLWINHFAVTLREAGGTRHAELARELARRGWDVTIAASDFTLHARRYSRRSGPEDREVVTEIVDGVRFAWLWASPYSRNDWRRGMNWLSFARSVRRWASAQPPFDVVIGSSPHLFAAWAGLRAARRMGAPFVFEVRDLWPESLLAGGGRRGPFYLTLDLLARRLYRAADRILVLAAGTGEYLRRERGVPAAKIAYVPNGVDPDAFTARTATPETGQPFTLVYAGAHGPANGLDTVLDAAARLRTDTGIRFLLVGDGPSKEALVRSATERGLTNVEFRAPIAKSGMPGLLAAADAGLMVLRPSPLFSFGVSPNKLFDYLATSLPVVCNVDGDVANMLADARAGEQAADAGSEALADAILRLRARGRAELERMGAAGRQWVEREHSRPMLAGRLDAILSELAAS